MSVLAALLIAVGLTDLIRPRSQRLGYAVAPVAIAACALSADLHTVPDVVLLVVAAGGAVAWAALNDRAHAAQRTSRAAPWVLLAAVVVQLGCTGWVSASGGPLADWLRSTAMTRLRPVTPELFLLVIGLFLVQLSTGNLLVRGALHSIGAMRQEGRPQASDQLRGGRLLGPLERVFILGLGLVGAYTAVALVVAAKGLIRFPELSSRRSERTTVNGVGIDEITEYFLLGSFTSWLVAMAGLGLAHLS